MKLDAAFADAARLLTTFALSPSLELRFCDLYLRLGSTYDRALALRRIGGAGDRRARIAALQLARIVGEARSSLDRGAPRGARSEGRAA